MRAEQRQRTWAAALTLYFLAPILGEVFSFNTPPLAFILDPGKFIFEPSPVRLRRVSDPRGRAPPWPRLARDSRDGARPTAFSKKASSFTRGSIPALRDCIIWPSTVARGIRVGSGPPG